MGFNSGFKGLISHTLGPTDLLHPSPAPHFKTFQVFLYYYCCCYMTNLSTDSPYLTFFCHFKVSQRRLVCNFFDVEIILYNILCARLWFVSIPNLTWGTRWRSWLRHCATSRKVAGSIPDGVTGIFHWHNPSGRTMALGSTQPLTEISTRNVSWG